MKIAFGVGFRIALLRALPEVIQFQEGSMEELGFTIFQKMEKIPVVEI